MPYRAADRERLQLERVTAWLALWPVEREARRQVVRNKLDKSRRMAIAERDRLRREVGRFVKGRAT